MSSSGGNSHSYAESKVTAARFAFRNLGPPGPRRKTRSQEVRAFPWVVYFRPGWRARVARFVCP